VELSRSFEDVMNEVIVPYRHIVAS
jgi:hypothetical protein